MENGEQYFYSIAESFKSPNKDVETFLKTKAVQATKLNTATTYLVYKENSPDNYLESSKDSPFISERKDSVS